MADGCRQAERRRGRSWHCQAANLRRLQKQQRPEAPQLRRRFLSAIQAAAAPKLNRGSRTGYRDMLFGFWHGSDDGGEEIDGNG